MTLGKERLDQAFLAFLSGSVCSSGMSSLWRELALIREREWRDAVRNMAHQPGVLFDMGGGTPYQGYISAEDVGPRTRYFCLDISPEARPHVVADVTRLPLASSSVNYILCNAVLEHVRDPQWVVEEMHRVLRRPGQVLVSVPFVYPYHDRVDYYRFTDEALHYLFRRFDQVEVVPVGDYLYVALLFLTGFNFTLARWLSPGLGPIRLLVRQSARLCRRLSRASKRRNLLRSLEKTPVGWYVYGRKL